VLTRLLEFGRVIPFSIMPGQMFIYAPPVPASLGLVRCLQPDLLYSPSSAGLCSAYLRPPSTQNLNLGRLVRGIVSNRAPSSHCEEPHACLQKRTRSELILITISFRVLATVSLEEGTMAALMPAFANAHSIPAIFF